MEKISLILIAIILFSLILNVVTAHERREYTKQIKTSTAVLTKINPDSRQEVMDKERTRKHKKSKRNAYRRNWSSKSTNYDHMPPYLVFNRKMGAYYPYYSYPIEQGIMRRNMQRYMKRRYSKS